MKKTIVIALVAIFCGNVDVNAQGFLKGLADKAKEKVEKKVEGTIGKAADKALGSKPKEAKPEVKAQVQSDNDNDRFQVYVEELAAPDAPEDWRYTDIGRDVESDDVTFNSIEEAINAFPPLATAQQMLNKDVAPLKTLVNFRQGVNAFAENVSANMVKATDKAKMKAGKSSTSAAQRAQMDNGAAQIFAYMQQHGIDPEKMSDKEMEAILKKAVMSGEINLSGIGGGFAIDPEYSEEQDEAINQISAKIDAVMKKIDEAATSEVIYTADCFGLEKTLKPLYAEMQAAWLTSDACKQVQAIEMDIDKRAWEYIEKHPDYANNGAVIEYPDFWVQGRKQQNEIIRSFNMANAEKWRKVLQEIYDKHLPSVKEVAAVDKELEVVFTDKSDMIYNNLKQQLASALMQWSNLYHILLNRSYGAPLVYEVEESKSIGM